MTVTVVNVDATVDGLVNTVTAQLTLTPVFLRTVFCAVEEVNVVVEHVFAHILGPLVTHVTSVLCVVTFAVPNGNVLVLPWLWFLLCFNIYIFYFGKSTPGISEHCYWVPVQKPDGFSASPVWFNHNVEKLNVS